MRIFMVTSESIPFSKSGGLADVVGDLSTKLCEQGCDVRIILPAYSIKVEDAGALVAEIKVNLLGGPEDIEIRSKTVGDVIFYFVCHPLFNQRRGIYGDTSFTPYPDNLLRFTILNKAALALCVKINWIPDVFHCHDWTCALLPYFINQQDNKVFAKSRTLFTIHNLAYQGLFPRMEFIQTMSEYHRYLLDGNQINMLKCGLIYSDFISTVSPTYAKEIQTGAQGCKMERILSDRKDRLVGILNGIDTVAWNPETDPLIPYHFSSDDLSGKEKLKAFVQKRFDLPENPNVPLFVMVTRLAWQKGIEEFIVALENLLGTGKNCQFLIIGTGDSNYENRLRELSEKYGNLSVNLVFSNEAAHLAEAAGDFFLMPSHYEPCGLNQMYSLRYATIPIVHSTGGLADSILDFKSHRTKGNGIVIPEITPESILDSIDRAIEVYGKSTFTKLRKTAMSADLSWDNSAEKYILLYKKVIETDHVFLKGGLNA